MLPTRQSGQRLFMSTHIQAAAAGKYAGSSIEASLTGVTAGHNIRVALIYSPKTLRLAPISDGTNTYTRGASATFGTSTMQTAFNPNTPGGRITVTASFSGGILMAGVILVEEWSGDATTGQPDGPPIAGFVKGGGKANCLSVGDVTTTVSGDDIWCVMYQAQGVAPSVGSGFTMASHGLAGGSMYSQHQVQDKAGTITPDWIAGANSWDNFIGAIAFKPLSGDSSGKRASLALLGVGCGIWAAKRIEQNPSVRRRDLILPRRRLLMPQSLPWKRS